MEDEDDFKLMVLEEVMDHQQNLVDLFEEPQVDADFLKHIFRIFHSIKGTSKAGGFEIISHVTHDYENVILMLKEDELVFGDNTQELFLCYIDWLGEALELRRDDKVPYSDDVLKTLNEYLNPAPTQNHEEEIVTVHTGVDDKLKVLVVEDESDLQVMYADFFESEFNLSVIQCNDGALSDNLLAGNGYELIILDNHLPNKNGLSILKDLRNGSSINAQTPILFVTGFDYNIKPEEIDLFKDVFVVQKPFEFKELEYYTKVALACVRKKSAA